MRHMHDMILLDGTIFIFVKTLRGKPLKIDYAKFPTLPFFHPSFYLCEFFSAIFSMVCSLVTSMPLLFASRFRGAVTLYVSLLPCKVCVGGVSKAGACAFYPFILPGLGWCTMIEESPLNYLPFLSCKLASLSPLVFPVGSYGLHLLHQFISPLGLL
jgi:hypothetical protein